MARPWVRWLSRIPIIAIAAIAALALPWALSWLWRWLPKQGDIWIVVAIAADTALAKLAARRTVGGSISPHEERERARWGHYQA